MCVCLCTYTVQVCVNETRYIRPCVYIQSSQRLPAIITLTCDNGGHAPADGVVEPHGAVVDVALLCLHAVDVEAVHEHPGKRGHEEVVQQDGHNCAQKLHRRECKEESNYSKQAEKKKSWGSYRRKSCVLIS